jgi:Domain of unknown function (DUF4920)
MRCSAIALCVLICACAKTARETGESASSGAAVQSPPPASAEPQSSAPVGATSATRALPGPLGSGPSAHGHFGAPFTGAPKQQLKRVLASPDAHKDQPLTVSGFVRRVCQRKGCWMELATAPTDEAARCRIRFKDYGFFVPTDAQGAQATVEGVLMVNRVTAARVKHLEEEGARFESKNPDGSANETQLVAVAVALER